MRTEHDIKYCMTDGIPNETLLALKTCMEPSKQCVECPFNDKEPACYALNAHMKELNDKYGELNNE